MQRDTGTIDLRADEPASDDAAGYLEAALSELHDLTPALRTVVAGLAAAAAAIALAVDKL